MKITVNQGLPIKEHVIHKLICLGQIPSIKIAGQWRFKKSLIDQMIQDKFFKNLKRKDNYTIIRGEK